RYFDPVSGGGYQARHFSQEQLSHDPVAGEFILTDTLGDRLRFFDFSASLPAERGKLVSFTDPAGGVTSVVSRDANGEPLEVQRSFSDGTTTTTESYLYAYVASGANAGKLQSVTLRRQSGGGAWLVVREADYAYYDGVEPYGNLGDLKTATIKNG